jgi:hypothetical protein
MDVFCRCKGCSSCNPDIVPGAAKCSNCPQKYTIDTPQKIRTGYRKFCKPAGAYTRHHFGSN